MTNKQTQASLDSLEERLGYAFKSRDWLETALTTPSYRAENEVTVRSDNQRLEFLGDAVFGLLSAQHLFARYPTEDEGALTVRRSGLASGKSLAVLARQIGLGSFLLLGRRDEVNGARDHDKPLADAMEAVLGAAWCDGGLSAVQAIYDRVIPDEVTSLNPWAENPKGALQELAQRHAWSDSPVYEVINLTGPDHAPEYTVRVQVAGGHAAEGLGNTKRAAESAAALALLEQLNRMSDL